MRNINTQHYDEELIIHILEDFNSLGSWLLVCIRLATYFGCLLK